MKISNKIKKQIIHLIGKMLSDTSKTFKQTFFFALMNILDTKGARSLPEHNMYFAWCEWLAPQFPAYKGIRFWDKDTVHLLLKKTQKVTTIAWNNMDQDTFNNYFNEAQKWVALYVFECDHDDMMLMFKGSLKKKEYDDEGNLIETN